MRNNYPVVPLLGLLLHLPYFLNAQCPDNAVNAGDDLYFCSPPPTGVKLNGQINAEYLWSNWIPTTGLSDPSSLTPTVTINQSISYVLESWVYGPNLVVDGDFESGQKVQQTDLLYSPGDITPAGSYDIVSDPQVLDPTFPPCTDNSGKGNMMIFRGDPSVKRVWCQDFPVTPNTIYLFSFYTTMISSGSTPSLSINFNDTNITSPATLNNTTCRRENHLYSWNSGDATAVNVCIAFNPISPFSFDSTQVVALDDIKFYTTCRQRDTMKIAVAPAVNAVATPPFQGIATCKNSPVQLSGVGSSTGTNFNYQWETLDGNIVSGANTLSPVVNESGTYTLTVSYQNGPLTCSESASAEVQYYNPLQAFINLPPDLNCEVKQVSLVGGATLPGPNQFQWTASNGGNIVSGANVFVAKVDQPGDYTLVVTNVNTGCTAEVSTSVQSNTTPPKAVATAPPLLCSKQQTVLSGAGSSTGNNFTYAWTSPDSTAHIVSGQDSLYAVADAPGMYILTVTNQVNKCTSSDTVVVALDTLLPVVSIQQPGALNCLTDTLTLSATINPANASLVWTASPGGNMVGRTDTSFVVITAPAVYTLTATNPVNGCTVVVADTVIQNIEPPVATIAPAGSITCEISNVTLQGGGSSTGAGIVYAWTSSGGGNIVSGDNTLTPVVNAPGTYQLLVSNQANGCTASASVQVNADTSAVVAVANAPSNINCLASSVTLNANGSTQGTTITYNWTTTDGQILSGAATPNPVAGAPGTYTLLLTNSANGCSSTDVAVVAADLTPPGATLTVPANINCFNASVNLQSASTANPALLGHTWTLPDNSTINTGTTPTLNATQAGNYFLVVTNTQNGCTSTAAATVVAFENVTAAVDNQTNINCFGAANGSISSIAGGGDGNYTYLWSNNAATAAIANLDAGVYTLTVTDGEGCTATASATVSQPDELVVSTSSTPPSSPGAADGTATATPSGGVAPYGYLWSNNETTPTIAGLISGFYTVTITDANGCTKIVPVEVGEGNCNLLAEFTPVDPACSGQNTGQATVLINGGTAPFDYLWSNNSTQQTATNLAAGTYTVTVTDANDCQIIGTVTLGEPQALSLVVETVTNTSCAQAPEGSATVLAGGGTGTLSISWDNGQTGPTATGLIAGTYTATATDENGCTSTATATIEAVDQLAPQIQAGPVTVPLGPSGSVTLTQTNLNATITDNCGIFTVQITPEAFDCSDLGEQTVTLTATDESGNSSSTTLAVTIIDNIAPTLVCSPNLVRCAGDDVVEYVAPVATDNCLSLGGQFALTNGLPSGSIFPPGVTTNTYTFTDAQGNVGSCSFNVTVLNALTVTLDSVINDVNNQGTGGVLVSVSGSLPGYSYVWTSNGQPVATTQDLSGVGAGVYTLLVTDPAGCTSVAGPFEVSNVSGTNNPALFDLVGIFPNPTSSLLYAIFPNPLASVEKHIAVFDATGRRVLEQHDGGQKQVTLDMGRLPDGLYTVMIRVQDAQGVWKIVVNK